MKNEKNNGGLTLPKIIILGVVIAILAIGGGVIGSMFDSEKAAEFFAATDEETVEITVPLSEFLLNLKPVSSNDKSYLRIEFSLMVLSPEDEEELLAQEAVVRDAVIAILRQKTADTIFSEENGSLTVKTEIKEKINEVIGRVIIEDIYVTNMVMQ